MSLIKEWIFFGRNQEIDGQIIWAAELKILEIK